MTLYQECARYLETLKAYENKPVDSLRGIPEQDFTSKFGNVITTIRGMNKKDSLTLGSKFKNMKNILNADLGELESLPGIGSAKVVELNIIIYIYKYNIFIIHIKIFYKRRI